MRTLLFLVVGFLQLAACLLLGRLFSAQYPAAPYLATVAFVALWLAVSGVNFWLGVARAGYGVADELPIFLPIFGLPTAVALVMEWRLL